MIRQCVSINFNNKIKILVQIFLMKNIVIRKHKTLKTFIISKLQKGNHNRSEISVNLHKTRHNQISRKLHMHLRLYPNILLMVFLFKILKHNFHMKNKVKRNQEILETFMISKRHKRFLY